MTNADGDVTQHVAYIPYGEVFIEERNGVWNTPYLFNAKELDEETGLYYYGARYLNPKDTRWLSVDPMFEKYVGMTPYNYCAGNPVKLVDVDGREPCKGGKSNFKRFLERTISRIRSFHINLPSFNRNRPKNDNKVLVKPEEKSEQKEQSRPTFREVPFEVSVQSMITFTSSSHHNTPEGAEDYLYNQLRQGIEGRNDFSDCSDVEISISFSPNINKEQRNRIMGTVKNIFKGMGMDDTAVFYDAGDTNTFGKDYGIVVNGFMYGGEQAVNTRTARVRVQENE